MIANAPARSESGDALKALTAVEARDVASVLHPFTDLASHRVKGPLVIERGHGVFVVDSAGKEYIDALSGLWCTSLGYGDEALIEAAVEQLRTLSFSHAAMHRSTRVLIDLAERLLAVAPGRFSKVFFVGSGSEANDTQVKLQWYCNNARGRPRKKKIISRIGAYHGSTLVSASLSGSSASHRHFDLPFAPFKHTACPHYYRYAEGGETEEQFSERLARELEHLILQEDPDTVAAFIAEPVMGAGGVIVPPRGYFGAVQNVLRKHDITFIVDEVICGFGRTGCFWGSQTYGLEPNALSCGKALSSAYLPIGAVLIDESTYDAAVRASADVGVFSHGFTFGGHPAAAAVALRTLQVMEERSIVARAQRAGVLFQQRLRTLTDYPIVGDARGVGLLGAIEFTADKATRRRFDSTLQIAAYCAARCESHGLIVRPLGDVVALCPPLVISDDEIGEVFVRLRLALEDTMSWVARQAPAAAGDRRPPRQAETAAVQEESSNPKAAAWDIIGGDYWSRDYQGGPTPQDIERYLAGVAPDTRVAVIGASTRFLIGAALERVAGVTVFDFSAVMCGALAAVTDTTRCRIVRHDMTTPVPDAFCEQFDLLLADRLINRFTPGELHAALTEMLRLLRDAGEIRSAVRFGLYKRDLPLIEEGSRRGTVAEFFDLETRTIDYGKAGDILDTHLEPHGSLPMSTVREFYRRRGAEKRWTLPELARCVAGVEVDGRGLALTGTVLLHEADDDWLLSLHRRPANIHEGRASVEPR